MAIQYMDNFQFYGSSLTRMAQGMPWTIWEEPGSNGTALVDDPDTNADADSIVLRHQNTYETASRIAIPTEGQQIGIAGRIYLSALPNNSGNGAGFQFNNSSNNALYVLHAMPTGALRLVRRNKNQVWTGSGDTVIETTSGPVITAGVWYHIEWYMDTATGDYEVRVEGVPVLDGNDASHYTDNIAIIAMIGRYNGVVSDDLSRRYVKDLIVWDDTGTANNDFIGPVTIYSLVVDGDVSDTDVTPSTGTAIYATMDELSTSDTDYSTMGLTPSEAVMTFEDVPADVVSIRAAMTVVRAQKTDGGDATLQVGLISDGSEDTGSDDAQTTSFRYQYDVSEFDPDTSAAWTPVSINAATIRLNRTL